jgi:tetratricopeptide (TPR) repeat protein
MAQTDSELDLEQVSRFFDRKVSRYIFLVIDDERVLKNLIADIQSRLGKKKKKIRTLELNPANPSVYFQVKAFVNKNRCDGLIITGLNALIYKYSHDTLHLLNESRDRFEDFSLPTAFVVNKANLRKIINGASDFYQLRDLPDFHFEGLKPAEDLPGEGPQDDFEDSSLKAQLLEEQLEKAEKDQRVNKDVINNFAVPLLLIHIQRGDYKKMEALYNRYLKGRENEIKNKRALFAYFNKMLESGRVSISSRGKVDKDKGKLDLEDLLQLRREYIRTKNWDMAADVTFALERYFTLQGSHRRSMRLLKELDITKLNEGYQTALYLRMGDSHLRFGEYDHALSLFEKAKKIAEKNNNSAQTSAAFYQIGRIYEERGRYEDALKQYERSLEIDKKIGDIRGVSRSLHHIGIMYQKQGRFKDALTQYKKSLEIKEKIGHIASTAMTKGQMGLLYLEQNKIEAALKLFIQAFQVLNKIGSPFANSAREDINEVLKKLPKDKFNEILKEFDLTIDDLGLGKD